MVGRSATATFDNRCQLLAATLRAAGPFGSAQGRVQREGPCAAVPRTCTSSLSCEADQHCSVEDGVCNRPPGCDVPGRVCPAVCTGTCVPDVTE